MSSEEVNQETKSEQEHDEKVKHDKNTQLNEVNESERYHTEDNKDNHHDKPSTIKKTLNPLDETKYRKNLNFYKSAAESNYEKMFHVDSSVDRERLYHENINLKNLLNKKNSVINELKFNYIKANDINKRNVRAVEEYIGKKSNRVNASQSKLNTSNVSGGECLVNSENQICQTTGNDFSDMEKDISQLLEYGENATYENINLGSTVGLKKLHELSVISKLKMYLYSYKEQLRERDFEISRLKNNSKCSRFSELDGEYRRLGEEMKVYKSLYDQAKLKLIDKEAKLKATLDEVEEVKIQAKKYKEKLEEKHHYISMLYEDSEKTKTKTVQLEEKIRLLENNGKNKKSQIKQLEQENIDLKKELENLKKFKEEKSTLETKLSDSYSKNSQLSQELNKKINKISELEKKMAIVKKNTDEKLNEMSKKCKSIESSYQNFKTEKEVLMGKLEESNKKNQEHENTIKDLEAQLNEVKENLSNQEKSNYNSGETIREKDSDIKKLKKEVGDLNQKNSELASECEGYKGEITKLLGQVLMYEEKERESMGKHEAQD